MHRRKLSKQRTGDADRQTVVKIAKPKSKSAAIIVGIIITLMVFSSIAIGFFYSPGQDINQNKVEYGDFVFTNKGNGWFANIGSSKDIFIVIKC